VAYRLLRFLQRLPDTGGDSFRFLRHRIAASRFKQKEMAILVYGLAAESEIPIDDLDRAVEQQLLETGFLRDFPPRRLGRRLVALEMPLGESPILVGGADQEKAYLSVGPAAEDDPAGARLPLGAGLRTAITRTA